MLEIHGCFTCRGEYKVVDVYPKLGEQANSKINKCIGFVLEYVQIFLCALNWETIALSGDSSSVGDVGLHGEVGAHVFIGAWFEK